MAASQCVGWLVHEGLYTDKSMGQSYSFCIWELFFRFIVPSAGMVCLTFFVLCQENGRLHFLARHIKSLNILLHANHYTRLLISHCMQLGNYLFVLLAYYMPHAFGATEKFSLNVFPYTWTYLKHLGFKWVGRWESTSS